MSAVTRNLLVFCLAAGLAATIHFTQRALDTRREIRFEDASPVFLPKGEVLKAMSMGYRGLMADYFWVKSVLYYGRRVVDEDNPYWVYSQGGGFGDEHQHDDDLSLSFQTPSASSGSSESGDTATSLDNVRHQIRSVLDRRNSRGLVNYIYPLLDRVTTLDPHFLFPYLFGGVYLMLDTGETGEALTLLQKGYEANPQAWQLPFYIGWIEWLYRNDAAASSRYLAQAVTKPGCPDYAVNLMHSITRSANLAQTTRLFLEGVLSSTDNARVRERVAEAIERFTNE